MRIAYTDPQTGKVTICGPGSAFVPLYPGSMQGTARTMTGEELAASLDLPPGTWREITPQEAAALQAPTREDEIKAAISALEAKQTPRLMGDAMLGNQDDMARLQDIRGQITALRTELAGL